MMSVRQLSKQWYLRVSDDDGIHSQSTEQSIDGIYRWIATRMNIPEYESLLSADASSLSLPQLSLLLPSLTTRVLRDLFNFAALRNHPRGGHAYGHGCLKPREFFSLFPCLIQSRSFLHPCHSICPNTLSRWRLRLTKRNKSSRSPTFAIP